MAINLLPHKSPTFRDLLSKDCGCIVNSTYDELVVGLNDELDELTEALLFSKNLNMHSSNAVTIDIALEYVSKAKSMIIDLKRKDIQSINRLFAIVKYLIYVGGMRKKLSMHALEELSDCAFIVNRLIGLLTNSAYTCVVNDKTYREKVYNRLLTRGCIRSSNHNCKGK